MRFSKIQDKWALGDIVLKEAPVTGSDRHNKSWAAIVACSRRIFEETGVLYAFDTLRRYRRVSYNFPPGERILYFSHKVHVTCGTPERLKAVLKCWNAYLRTQGEAYRPIKVREVKDILKKLEVTHPRQ